MRGLRRACGFVLKTALFLVLTCQPAFSLPNQGEHDRWAVQVSSDGRSYFTDEPNCHASEYFSHDIQQQFREQFRNPKDPNFFEDMLSGWRIGEISGYKIEQREHRINQSSANPMTVKMLLVERKPKELCEIYHQEWSPREVDVKPAYIVTVGDDVILVTKDMFGEIGVPLECYWTFDANGPINLEVVQKIYEIQKRLLPEDVVDKKGGGFDLRTLTYSKDVWKLKDRLCCPTGGSIEIKFALKDHQLIVVSHSYKKN